CPAQRLAAHRRRRAARRDGFLYVVERTKDLIIRGGFNVYPREVEDVLYAHPAVAEAAVVGVRDALMGEEVCAFVALKRGAAAEAADRLTDLPLRLPESLAELARGALGAPLGLELRIVQRLTRLFLDVALGFLGLALDLVAIHECASVSDLLVRKKLVQGDCQRPRSCRSATRVSVDFF